MGREANEKGRAPLREREARAGAVNGYACSRSAEGPPDAASGPEAALTWSQHVCLNIRDVVLVHNDLAQGEGPVGEDHLKKRREEGGTKRLLLKNKRLSYPPPGSFATSAPCPPPVSSRHLTAMPSDGLSVKSFSSRSTAVMTGGDRFSLVSCRMESVVF